MLHFISACLRVSQLYIAYSLQSSEAAAADWSQYNRRQRSDTEKQVQMVRNRRYKKLQELMGEGEYFSDAAMKLRQPTLYYK